MSRDSSSQLKQNELHVEFGNFQRLVEMNVDAESKRFKLTFDNERLSTESTGQVLIKCRLPGKSDNMTLEYGGIDELTLRQLIDLSIQQQQMRVSTDYKGIPAWLEKSLQRISDLRLGRDMLDVLTHQRRASPVMLSKGEMLLDRKFDLRLYINEALRKEVDELTRHLRVRPDGIAHIRALLNVGGNEANAPMIRYGLNAVNSWSAPQLQDALQWIADQLSLPADVRSAAASFL